MKGKFLELAKRQWFLGALLMIILIGGLFPQPVMHSVGRINIRFFVVSVMFLMSLTLDTSQITAILRQPGGVGLGVLLGYTLVPLLAWLASRPFWTCMPDLAVGLLIVSAMPCTLASATLWTRMAGGNDALALLITVGSNSLNFLVAPPLLSLTLGQAVTLSPLSMMRDLLVIILLPVLGGQMLRMQPLIRHRADCHRGLISLLSKCLILLLVLIGIARAAIRVQDEGQMLRASYLLSLLGTVALVHSLALLGCELVGLVVRLPRFDRLALLFAGSQKTLPASLFVAQAFFPNFALASIPPLFYHAGQLIIDSFIAERLRAAPAEGTEAYAQMGASTRAPR